MAKSTQSGTTTKKIMKGIKFIINLRNGLTFNTYAFDERSAVENFKMWNPAYANEKIYPIWYIHNTGEFA